MTKSNIILTGFMATGKTTVGKRLADQLGYDFVDTDELIGARSGRSVAEIFREKGEAAFREMEAALARELGEQEGLVIATGGKMMLDPVNAAVLSKRGRIFCLVASVREIFNRVQKDKHVKRPLLDGPDPMADIVALLQQRQEGYNRFLTLETTDRTPEDVADTIIRILQAPERSDSINDRSP